MSHEDVSRRALLRALGAGTGLAGVGGANAASWTDGDAPASSAGADDVPVTDPAARAAAAGRAVPRHLLPGATGSARADGPVPGNGPEPAERPAAAGSTVPGEHSTDGFERCYYPNAGKELYGPTDINAQSANGAMAVGLNDRGTVTVLRWPRPSFYDQIKYYATDRDADRYGAAPNEGAFLGLRVETPDGDATEWLREWELQQRYATDDSDAVVTEHRSDDLGLTVTVTDVVAREDDALVRDVTVERDPGSSVEATTLVAFENVNPVVTKLPRAPATDWCREEDNHSLARYDDALDAVVHETSGVDNATGERRSVAVSMGFAEASTGHQVGGDAYEEAASPAGGDGPARDAYDDAADWPLSGNDSYAGQATGALARRIDPGGGTATLVVAAGEDATGAGTTLELLRDREPAAVRAAKREWFDELLADAPLPDADDEDVLALCRRALVTLVSVYDPDSGAVVASIATQSPYGEDWPRDGAYFNYLLSAIGRHDWVETRNRFYAAIQQGSEEAYPDPWIPPGNWAMNYYADGVPGGPIPWEIDETGYGIWTMVDHYDVTGDESYLRSVYPAIQRAADFLVDCRDPENGLQCEAWEDDVPEPKQTIVGAGTVWLGLGAAVRAARALDRTADAARYALRRAELAAAIDEQLWAAEPGAYGPARAGHVMSEVGWPIGFRPTVGPSPDDPLDHPRLASHMDADWAELQTTFAEPDAGNREVGLYECKGLVPLAKARREEPPGSLDQVRDGLEWVAKRHATADTHVMGEVWTVEDGEVITVVSQPHVWEQSLFYMAALEAWPPADLDFDPDSSGGVLEALRERNAPGDDERRGPPDDVPRGPPGDSERA